MSFLAFHKNFQNNPDDENCIQFWICETQDEAVDHVFSVWENMDWYRSEQDQEFKDSMRNGATVWREEWHRKNCGELFGVLMIDDSKHFSIDVEKLLEKSVTIGCDIF